MHSLFWVLCPLVFLICSSCVFKFDVPSSKTKLEKQVLGYKPLIPKDRLLKIVTRTAEVDALTLQQHKILRDKMKASLVTGLLRGFLGEAQDGAIVVLSKNKWEVSLSIEEEVALGNLIEDENFSRKKLSELENRKLQDYSYKDIYGIWYEESPNEWTRFK